MTRAPGRVLRDACLVTRAAMAGDAVACAACPVTACRAWVSRRAGATPGSLRRPPPRRRVLPTRTNRANPASRIGVARSFAVFVLLAGTIGAIGGLGRCRTPRTADLFSWEEHPSIPRRTSRVDRGTHPRPFVPRPTSHDRTPDQPRQDARPATAGRPPITHGERPTTHGERPPPNHGETRLTVPCGPRSGSAGRVDSGRTLDCGRGRSGGRG